MKASIEQAVASLLFAAKEIEREALARAAHLRQVAAQLAEAHAHTTTESVRRLKDARAIDDLPVGPRVYKGLQRIGAETVEEISHLPDKEFLKLPNFGKLSLRLLREEIGPARPPFVALVHEPTESEHWRYRLPHKTLS